MTDLFAADTAREIRLYDWQAEAIEALRENIRRGVKNQILASPTGSGKTMMSAYLIDECRKKHRQAVFVCDRKALIDQTSATFDEYGIDHGIIQADHWRWRPYAKVQIASAQTLARRKWPAEPSLMVIDEAHSLYKVVTDRISERDCVVIGLTATPFSRGMGKYYDDVVTVRTLNQLTADGYLAPFVVYAATEPDMTGAKVTAGEWTDAEAEKRSLPIVGDAVTEYLRHGEGGRFIAFGVTIAHCEELQRQFMAAGVQCALYTQATPDTERGELVREFRKRDSYIRGLISVAALAKGFDVPGVECVIICRPLRKSLAEHIQMIGRGLRRDPENPEKTCKILDHSGNSVRMWSPMMDFFANGATELDDGKPKPKKQAGDKPEPEPYKCPQCAHVHRPAPMCPMCGHAYPRRNTIEHVPGELKALVAGTPTNVAELRQDVYSQLIYFQQSRGWHPAWARHRFRDLFKSDPTGLSQTPRPPTAKTQSWIKSELIRYAKRQKKAS